MAVAISELSDDRTRRTPSVDPSLYDAIGELTATFALLENTLKSGFE